MSGMSEIEDPKADSPVTEDKNTPSGSTESDDESPARGAGHGRG